jgi:hypothetical protein
MKSQPNTLGMHWLVVPSNNPDAHVDVHSDVAGFTKGALDGHCSTHSYAPDGIVTEY